MKFDAIKKIFSNVDKTKEIETVVLSKEKIDNSNNESRIDKDSSEMIKWILDYSLNINELKELIYKFNIPSTGNKEQLIKNIVKNVSQDELFSSLRVDKLRYICGEYELKTGKKEDMVSAILQYIKTYAETPREPYINATVENVISKLKELTISDEISNESDVEEEIMDHLSYFFKDVTSQYFLGGYLGLKIDLDIDNGKVGIETKLAESLFNNSSEIYRMIGQGVYYQKKRYGDNLVIAVAGTEEELNEPIIREALSFLSNINIKWITVPIE